MQNPHIDAHRNLMHPLAREGINGFGGVFLYMYYLGRKGDYYHSRVLSPPDFRESDQIWDTKSRETSQNPYTEA